MTIPALLEQLIGPPVERPRPADWDRIAADYGLEFPQDYRDLVTRYPPILFYEFIGIAHPTGAGWGLLPPAEGFLRECREARDAGLPVLGSYDPATGEETPVPGPGRYPAYPEPGGLFPWGSVVNSQKCFWLTDPDPERWTVVVLDRYDGWWHYKGTMTDFLADVISGAVRCPVFTDEFPDEWLSEEEGYTIDQVTG